MKLYKHYGTFTMISAATGILLSFLFSTGWGSEYHFIANVLHIMRLQFFGDEYGHDAFIDFPTKYALAFFVVAFSVGLAVYLTAPSKLGSSLR